MSENLDLHELRELLDAVAEESITAEQMHRLEQLVLAHPEAEAHYVQHMHMLADLSRQFRNPLPALTQPGSPGRTQPGSPTQVGAPRRWLSRGLVAGGLAAAIALTVYGLWEPDIVVPTLAAVEPTDNGVAILVHTSGAEWEETGMPTRTGAPLPAGTLKLKAGVAQIEFYSGATVILEGPAEFRLDSATQAYCTRGKLRVSVPPQAQGFTIGSPQMDLVDRGTEFGMSVGATTEVHVFQGKVELYQAGAARTAAGRQEVTTGRGVRLERAGDYQAVVADPAAFVTAQDLAHRTVADTRRRQQEWLQASAAIRQDAGLVLYYPFETDGPWNRTVRDRSTTPEPRHGAIVGCSWATSRWPGKQGLEFKRLSDRVRLHVPGEFASLTLVAWVRVDALSNSFNSLMMADAWEEGGVHWHINSAGEIALGIQGPNKRGGTDYRTPRIFTPERLGQWAQVAVVYDRDARQVTHYVDGKVVQQDALRFDLLLRIGDCELGNWNVGSRRDRQPIRNLSGCLDEFFLYNRALPARAIEQMYAQGR